MSKVHRHTAWGRVRRPKNILGDDGTVLTCASTTDATIVDSLVPTDDLTGTITAAAINTSTATITLTFGGGSVPDTALVGESVITRGFHPAIDGRLLVLTAVSAGDNTLSFKVPTDHPGQNFINSLSFQAKGTCTRQTLDGVKTENARFLHLYLHDATHNNGDTITVYGYNYAFGRWSILQVEANADEDVDDANASGRRVNATYVLTQDAKIHILPINGIDKVYFVSSQLNDSGMEFSAAISTF